MHHRPKNNLFKCGQIYRKDAQYSETDFWVFICALVFFSIFEKWSTFYSTFVVNWGIRDFCEPDPETLTSWLGGFNPKKSGAWVQRTSRLYVKDTSWNPSNITSLLYRGAWRGPQFSLHYTYWNLSNISIRRPLCRGDDQISSVEVRDLEFWSAAYGQFFLLELPPPVIAKSWQLPSWQMAS